MHPINRAEFRKVLAEAKKTAVRKSLLDILRHNTYLEYAQVVQVSRAVERALVEGSPELCRAEVRRFSEIVCGIADRVNAECMLDAKEFVPNEIKMFRDTKRSVVLDERYDIQNILTQKYKEILTNWISEKEVLEDLKKDEAKINAINAKLEREISVYHAFAAGAKHCDPLVQKDIETHIMQKTVLLEDGVLKDKHVEELRALAEKHSTN